MTVPVPGDSVEALLAAPRGRRLLMEFAFLGEPRNTLDSLWATVLSAGRAFDDGGTVMRLVIGVPDDTPEPEPATVAEVAAAVDRVRLPEPSAITLRTALAFAVDAARYWQEPDGTDHVARQPPVRQALRRVAEHLAPHLGSWAQPCDLSTQMAVRWQDAPDPPAAVSVETLRRLSEKQQAEELRAQRERPTDPAANMSGEWWSIPGWPVPSSNGRTADDSPAALWFVEDSMGWERAEAYPLALARNTRVYEVGNADDWVQLCLRFPAVVTAQRRHDWYRCTGRAGEWVQPDWAAVAAHYDGVHLQPFGYLIAAGTAIPVSATAASVIAGWNPGETYWLSPHVELGPASVWIADDAQPPCWRREGDGNHD